MQKTILSKVVLYTALFIFSLSLIKYFTFSVDKENDTYQSSYHENYNIYALDIPESLDFSEENVPLDMADIRERFDRELLVNSYWQSQTLLFIKRSHKYFPIIEPILKSKGVPDDFKYIALIESGLSKAVSPSGAAGYWHFLEKTAQEFGLEVNDEVDERYNLEKSTEAFCDYILEANKKFNNWTLAAASYNMGMSGLKKQVDRQKVYNYYDLLLNEETGRYVFRLLAVKEILESPNKYGFNFRPQDLYKFYDYKTITINSSIEDMAVFSEENGINYKILKELNPWLRQGYLHNSKNKEYKIKIATEGLYSISQPGDSL